MEVTREMVLPARAGRGLGGADRSRAALGVVRQRRRARRATRRPGRLPLGGRRGRGTRGRRGRARAAPRLRLADGRRRGVARAVRARGGGAAARASRHRDGAGRRARASGPSRSSCGARGRRRAVTDPGRVFAALADPHRRFLVEVLAARESATATELASELPVTRQAVSKHLAALADAGLVARVSARAARLATGSRRRRSTTPRLDRARRRAWDERLAALRPPPRRRRIGPARRIFLALVTAG